MSLEHLYGIEFKDCANQNKYLGGGLFRKVDDHFESYLDLRGTNVRFPMEFHQNGAMPEATYPDGSKGFVDFRKFTEFDFDPTSTAW